MNIAPAKDFQHGQIEIITVHWAVKTFQTFLFCSFVELLADVFPQIKLSFYVYVLLLVWKFDNYAWHNEDP